MVEIEKNAIQQEDQQQKQQQSSSSHGLSFREDDPEFRDIVNMLWITVPKNTPLGMALADARERAHKEGASFYGLVGKSMQGMAAGESYYPSI